VTYSSKKSASCLFAGLAFAFLIPCEVQSAHAEALDHKHIASAEVSAPGDVSAAPASPRRARKQAAKLVQPIAQSAIQSAPGPYYVDFRARTAASWGHAFVWYGKSSEKEVNVAGLTPAGDTLQYMLGYVTWVPSETGASYGDLDPEYLTANYRVYLNEADAQRVFAHIKHLQESSPVWSAEVSNCTNFVGEIAAFMGLKTPPRWERPETYINDLKQMNGGMEVVRLSSAE
jgi:hypothetical protein